MKIVIPDDYPSVYEGRADLARLRTLGEVEHHTTRPSGPDELRARLVGADACINVRSYCIFDRALLDALPTLRMISILGTGTDNVDLAYAAELGVVVTNTPGAAATSVAEFTIGLMFAVSRSIVLCDRRLRGGEWFHREGPELRGKTLGLIGLGAIGSEVARIGRGIGMRVIGWSFREDPERAGRLGVELVERDEVLRQADVVSLHLRNSPQSAGIIGARELGLMKQTAFLINTARGALVDQDALYEALRAGRIAGAGLDVFQVEPLPADSPLRGLDNVVLEPHLAAVTAEANARVAKMPVDNIANWIDGKPTHVVNPAALEHPRQKRHG